MMTEDEIASVIKTVVNLMLDEDVAHVVRVTVGEVERLRYGPEPWPGAEKIEDFYRDEKIRKELIDSIRLDFMPAALEALRGS
jgi:hypothetical protein